MKECFIYFCQVVKRRVDILEREGITFKTNINVGKDVTAKSIMDQNDAVVCALGATWPRDLPIPGTLVSDVKTRMFFTIKVEI